MIGEIQGALYGVPSNNFVDFLVSFIFFFFFDESNSCSNLIFIKKSEKYCERQSREEFVKVPPLNGFKF